MENSIHHNLDDGVDPATESSMVRLHSHIHAALPSIHPDAKNLQK